MQPKFGFGGFASSRPYVSLAALSRAAGCGVVVNIKAVVDERHALLHA